MELTPNMYVRTKKGIAKIVEIFDKENEPYEGAKYRTDTFLEIYYDSEYIGDEDIIGEPSHNIIDLIEEHDILLLFDKEYGENYKAEVVLDGSNFKVVVNYEQCVLLNLEYELITEEHIKLLSILTKEQFSAMEYKID